MLTALVESTRLGEYVDANLTLPFHFTVREFLQQDPPLDPRLKILSFDDTSVDRLQRADLTIDDWATVLAGIAALKPREILVDKVFSIIFDPMNKRNEALAKLRAIDVPIFVGSFAAEREYASRHTLDLSSAPYRLDTLLSGGNLNAPDFKDFRGWHIYGPPPELRKVLRGAGHIYYRDSGKVSAFLQPEPSVIVPQLGLFGERLTVTGDSFYVNDVRVPLNRRGQLIVDFSRQRSYYERSKRLGTAVLAAREGRPIDHIAAGDTVLILPEMYTGSADFKVTPLGILPGGFIHASVLNSVLRQQWIEIPWAVGLQVLVLGLLGMVLGNYQDAARFWLGLLGITVGAVGIEVYLFSFHSLATPTVIHLFAFWGTSLAMFADVNQRRETEARRVAGELSDAAEMAKAFRPDEIPSWPMVDIAAYHKPFSEASGDWFAFRRSPSGRFHHFVLCDVTGHGVQAALMVSICKTVLALYRDRSAALESPDFLAVYANDLNEMLFHHGRGQHLVTMLGITFDARESTLRYLSAGHPPPIFYREQELSLKKVRQLTMRSTLLGLTATFAPVILVQPIVAGDEVIAYTDGLPVNRHVRVLNQFVTQTRPGFKNGPLDLLQSVWNVETKKSGKVLDDDVSIVWFRVRQDREGAPPSPLVAG